MLYFKQCEGLFTQWKIYNIPIFTCEKAFFQSYFEDISHEKVWMNMPPAYVLSCKLGHTRAS